MIRNFGLVTLCFCQVALSILAEPAPTQDLLGTSNPEDLKELALALESLFMMMELVQQEQSRNTFDPDSIVNEIGKDPGRLFDWVRDNTYWAPYEGILRGPRGVLMDRLGSSLDRSLLLADLLRRAGYESRLAHVRLTEQQAIQLAQHVRPIPKNWEQTEGDEDKQLMVALEEFARTKGLVAADMLSRFQATTASRDILADEVVRRTEALVPRLAELVGEGGAHEDATPRLVSSLRNHWWLQQRQGSEWIDMDTILPDGRPDQRLAEPTRVLHLSGSETGLSISTSDEFWNDGSLWHEVEIRIIAETWTEENLTEHVVLTRTLRPAVLYGKRIVLWHASMNWPSHALPLEEQQSLEWFRKTALEQKEWLPALSIGETVETSSSFTSSGHINENPGRSAITESGRTRRQSMVGAIGALGGTPPRVDTPQGHVTAEWVEYELRSPSYPVRRIRRQIFDLIGPAARAEGVKSLAISESQMLERAMALLGETHLLLAGSWVSRPFVRHALIENRLAIRPIVSKSYEKSYTVVAGLATDQLENFELLSMELFALAMARQQYSPYRGDIYLDMPNVLTFGHRPDISSEAEITVKIGFDIVSNDVAVRPATEVQPFRIRMVQGLIDTVTEAALLHDVRGQFSNTSVVYAQSLSKGRQWHLLRDEREVAEKAKLLSTDGQQRVLEELRSGYWIAVPQGPEPDLDEDVWWRIQVGTGTTLGMGGPGRGQATTEYQVKHVKAVLRLNSIKTFCENFMQVGQVIRHYVELIWGDVGDFIRAIYGDDLERGLRKVSSCEYHLIRVLLGIPPWK